MRRLAIAVLAAALPAMTQSHPPSTVYVANVDFASGRLIEKAQSVSTEVGVHDPMWSPDGQLLGYVFDESGPINPVFVVRSAASGARIRQISVAAAGFAPVVWAGDGLYGIGWTSSHGTGVYRVNTETGVAEPAYIGTGHIRVSRDGKRVYFGRTLPGIAQMALIEREIDGGKEREVMRREWFQGMAISQDNQYIVTASVDRATNYRTVWLISTASGEMREVLRVPSELMASDLTAWDRGTKFWHAEWLPGGRSFLMLKRSADKTQDDEVWEVRLSGMPRKLDFHLPRTTTTYRLQPVGNKIVWVATTGIAGTPPESRARP